MANQILGRGKLYFEPEGESGERYLGNAPTTTINRASQTLDHYASTGGTKVLDNSVTLQVDEAIKFDLDEIVSENLAMFYTGSAANDDQSVAAGPFTESFTVQKGRWYQVGVTVNRPEGITGIGTVSFEDDATPTPAAITTSGNFTLDLANGRFYVDDDAADVANGDVVTIEYAKTAVTKDRVISARTTLYGALRFIADNPAGSDRNFYWPRVALSPDGDYQLLGDEWQKMGFNAKILERDASTNGGYITVKA